MLNDLIPLPQRLEGISIVGDRESPRNLSTSEIGESLNHDLPSANSTAIAAVQDVSSFLINYTGIMILTICTDSGPDSQ